MCIFLEVILSLEGAWNGRKEMDIKLDFSWFRVQAQDKIFTKTAAIYK